MAAPVLFVFFSAILSTVITSEQPLRNDGAPKVEDSPTRLQLQLRLLETKVYLLESSIDEKIRELREKDEKIRQMEEIMQGKLNSNAYFQSETEAVQGREFDVIEFTDKFPEKNAEELINQVIEDIILQDKFKDELEAQERVADEEIKELKVKAKDIHGAWFTALHSIAIHISHCQAYLVTYWNDCGRPALDAAIEKALIEMKAQVKSLAQLSIETIKFKLIPGLKKQSTEIVAYLEPNIQLLAAKTVDFYHLSKSSVSQFVFKAQEIADLQFRVAKKSAEPYIPQLMKMIDEATVVTRTHLANIRIALEPHTKHVLPVCKNFMKAADNYHHEVQDMLKNHRFTQSLATIELAWLLATALLSLPAVVMFKLTSAIFRKVANQHKRSSQRYHTVPTRRRLKRTHPEK